MPVSRRTYEKNTAPLRIPALGVVSAEQTKLFLERCFCYGFSMKKTASLLSIVGGAGVTGPQPARTLGKHGRSLWDRVLAEYDVDDVSGIELLTLACQSLDRAEALAERIGKDGVTIKTQLGPKVHPGVKEELALRGFVARQLQRLGLHLEPVRAAIGRPPKVGA